MTINPLLPIAAALLVAVAAPVLAQDVSEADRGAIEARIAEFDATMRSGDLAGLLGYTPPRVRTYIAAQFGVSEDALVDAVREEAGAAMETVTIDEFGMDLAQASFLATPDGARAYGLIPTVTTMTVEGAGTMRATSQTMAIEEDGEWYLVRVDDASQMAILRAVYPEFIGVDVPVGTMVPVE